MKKRILMGLLFAMCALVGCGNNDNQQANNNSETQQESQKESESEVEKERTITIPAAFLGEEISEEYVANIKDENGFTDAILNEDGSVTYVMAESVYTKYMEKLKQTMRQGCDDIISESETITAIEYNDDFTSFTITTSAESVSLQDSFTVMTLQMYSRLYNVFNGVEVENIHIDYVNADSGEIIHSVDSGASGEE